MRKFFFLALVLLSATLARAQTAGGLIDVTVERAWARATVFLVQSAIRVDGEILIRVSRPVPECRQNIFGSVVPIYAAVQVIL